MHDFENENGPEQILNASWKPEYEISQGLNSSTVHWQWFTFFTVEDEVTEMECKERK